MRGRISGGNCATEASNTQGPRGRPVSHVVGPQSRTRDGILWVVGRLRAKSTRISVGTRITVCPAQSRTSGISAYGKQQGAALCRMQSSTCDTLSRSYARRVLGWPAFPSAPPFPPPAPRSVARLCSQASSLLWRGLTSPFRASPASVPHLPGADQPLARLARREISRFPGKEPPYLLGSLTAPGRSATRRDAADRVAFRPGNTLGTREQALTRLHGQPARSPLPTLRPAPRGTCRTARGQCDPLRLLHCRGLPPPAPCRSPGALPAASPSFEEPRIEAAGIRPLRQLETLPAASLRKRSAGRSPPRARPLRAARLRHVPDRRGAARSRPRSA